ncbi:hypothetical protein B0T17DRAFT_509842 [Bombardia bombarda]|uniref:Uncharacterized protein n=1 Tax=Bombardia bombarda TaxID=252184 RepID=A0AA39WMX4_9PEZI|nr:hypothetical protein B0T17DRAFT_509842 [Bombardia bombarda]
MTTPPVPVSANRGDANPRDQATLYKIIMTPVIFISFLISLAIVDLKYSVRRSHFHAQERPGRMPTWLHRLIYRYRRYDYVPLDQHGQPFDSTSNPPSDSHWFYHSKQRKLVKMEAADAFEIRGIVQVFMALFALCVTWALWQILSWSVAAAIGLASSRQSTTTILDTTP